MAQNRRVQSPQRRRWYLILGVAVFSLTLVSLVLAWGSAEAERANSHFSADRGGQANNQEVIKLEFVYLGGDFISVTNAIEDFANLLSLETGLTIEASLQPVFSLVQSWWSNTSEMGRLMWRLFRRFHTFWVMKCMEWKPD